MFFGSIVLYIMKKELSKTTVTIKMVIVVARKSVLIELYFFQK
jgi:hypothetical protein